MNDKIICLQWKENRTKIFVDIVEEIYAEKWKNCLTLCIEI